MLREANTCEHPPPLPRSTYDTRVQGDRYLWPARQQLIRPKAVIGRIISGSRDKMTYLFLHHLLRVRVNI